MTIKKPIRTLFATLFIMLIGWCLCTLHLTELAPIQNTLKQVVDTELEVTSLTPALPADEAIEDYFDIAVALHKLAMTGDVNSQFELGRILSVCTIVAYDREILVNNLHMLYAYADELPANVIPDLERLMQACAHFYPENLELFFPQNELSLSRFASESDISWSLGFYWLVQAAQAGHEQAVINILGIPLLPPMTVNIDLPEINAFLSEQLQAGNPDILSSVSSCVDMDQSQSVVLMEIACEKTSQCRMLHRYESSLILQLNSLDHVENDIEQPTLIGSLENNIRFMDLPKMINEFKLTEPNYQEHNEQLQSSLQDEQFRSDLIEKCAQLMLHRAD